MRLGVAGAQLGAQRSSRSAPRGNRRHRAVAPAAETSHLAGAGVRQPLKPGAAQARACNRPAMLCIRSPGFMLLLRSALRSIIPGSHEPASQRQAVRAPARAAWKKPACGRARSNSERAQVQTVAGGVAFEGDTRVIYRANREPHRHARVLRLFTVLPYRSEEDILPRQLRDPTGRSASTSGAASASTLARSAAR